MIANILFAFGLVLMSLGIFGVTVTFCAIYLNRENQ